MSPFGAAGSDDADRPRHDWHAEKVKGDSHQIWRTQRVQANVESLRLFLRSSTGPNRAFEPQWLGRVRDPVRIAEGPTAIDAATQRRHSGFRLRLVDNLQPIGGGSGRGHPLSGTWETWMAPNVMPDRGLRRVMGFAGLEPFSDGLRGLRAVFRLSWRTETRGRLVIRARKERVKGDVAIHGGREKGATQNLLGYWTSEFMLGAFDHHDAGRWPLLRSSSAAEQVSPAPVSAHNPVQITQGE